ncbi:hypothetical protein ACJA23_02605 [Mycoplasma corogypsi]|uniref:hypothetical protein n=1 Tax=Mycoplasma corogypsi TaxID=2106 RepID=UPI0038738939
MTKTRKIIFGSLFGLAGISATTVPLIFKYSANQSLFNFNKTNNNFESFTNKTSFSFDSIIQSINEAKNIFNEGNNNLVETKKETQNILNNLKINQISLLKQNEELTVISNEIEKISIDPVSYLSELSLAELNTETLAQYKEKMTLKLNYLFDLYQNAHHNLVKANSVLENKTLDGYIEKLKLMLVSIKNYQEQNLNLDLDSDLAVETLSNNISNLQTELVNFNNIANVIKLRTYNAILFYKNYNNIFAHNLSLKIEFIEQYLQQANVIDKTYNQLIDGLNQTNERYNQIISSSIIDNNAKMQFINSMFNLYNQKYHLVYNQVLKVLNHMLNLPNLPAATKAIINEKLNIINNNSKTQVNAQLSYRLFNQTIEKTSDLILIILSFYNQVITSNIDLNANQILAINNINELTNLNEQIEVVNSNLIQTQNQIASIRNELAEINNQLETTKAESNLIINKTSEEFLTNEIKISSLVARKLELSDNLSHLLIDEKRHKNEKITLNKQFKEKESKSIQSFKDNQNKNFILKSLFWQISYLLINFNYQNNLISSYEVEIGKLVGLNFNSNNTSISDISQDVEKLDYKTKLNNEIINQLNLQKAENDKHRKLLENQISGFEVEKEYLRSKIRSLNQEIEAENQLIKAYNAKIDELNTNIGTLNNRIDQYNSKIRTLETDIQNYEVEIANLNNQISDLNTDKNNLFAKLNKSSELNSNLRLDNAALKDKIIDIEKLNITLVALNKKFNNDINNLNNENSKLQATIDEMHKKHQDEIKKLNEKAENLSKEKQDLINDIETSIAVQLTFGNIIQNAHNIIQKALTLLESIKEIYYSNDEKIVVPTKTESLSGGYGIKTVNDYDGLLQNINKYYDKNKASINSINENLKNEVYAKIKDTITVLKSFKIDENLKRKIDELNNNIP